MYLLHCTLMCWSWMSKRHYSVCYCFVKLRKCNAWTGMHLRVARTASLVWHHLISICLGHGTNHRFLPECLNLTIIKAASRGRKSRANNRAWVGLCVCVYVCVTWELLSSVFFSTCCVLYVSSAYLCFCEGSSNQIGVIRLEVQEACARLKAGQIDEQIRRICVL